MLIWTQDDSGCGYGDWRNILEYDSYDGKRRRQNLELIGGSSSRCLLVSIVPPGLWNSCMSLTTSFLRPVMDLEMLILGESHAQVMP